MKPRIRIQESFDAVTIYVNNKCLHIVLAEDFPGYHFKNILQELGYAVEYEEVG